METTCRLGASDESGCTNARMMASLKGCQDMHYSRDRLLWIGTANRSFDWPRIGLRWARRSVNGVWIARVRDGATRPLPLKHPLTFVLCIAAELGCGADEFIRHRSRRCCSAPPSALVPPPPMPFCPRHRAGVLPGKTAAPKWQPSTMPPRGPAGGDLWGFLCRGRKTTGNHGTLKNLENPKRQRRRRTLCYSGFADLCLFDRRLPVRSR